MRPHLVCFAALVVATACTGTLIGPGDPAGAVEEGALSDGGASSLPADGGLPCGVAQLVESICISCHGAPLREGAPMPLLTREDFLAPSPVDPSRTIAERSLLRMRDPLAPMPPSGPLTPEQVETFAAWLAAGLPERSCEPADAGVPDAGPPVLTCRSDSYLPTPRDDGDTASDFMAPGMACIACHLGLNFAGQNPLGLTHGEHVYDFMGTVFAAPHERDLCAPRLLMAATVEILSVDGGLVVRLPVNAGGNFQGNAPAGKPGAFRARVVTFAGAREMGLSQTSGDCNTCHTAEGREGAPGRIFLP